MSRYATSLAAVLVLVLGLAAAPPPADASGFYRFQHGGRATAQVGAFTARADDPAAVFYNPAAITRLEGVQLLGGLDFSNATDEYRSVTAGGVSADHVIEFPPAVYLTWNGDRFGRWALGLGVDAPYWYRINWDPVEFAPRFRSRVFDLGLWEIHPVAAYEIDERWSVGGGLRYTFGSLEQGVNSRLQVPGTGGQLFPAELLLDADTDIDGIGFDAAVHYSTNVWGWGAVYRSGVDLDGNGSLGRTVRDAPPDPLAQAALAAMLAGGGEPIEQAVDLPRELAAGVWIAPYPELRLELDASWQSWSDFAQSISLRGQPMAPEAVVQRGGWDDVISLRLGVEGDVGDALTLSGGIAWEPSPVPGNRVDPAFPRGDATVYAIGASYAFAEVIFDLGVSLHDHDNVSADFQEPLSPGVRSTYSADDTVWSASARWAF